MRHRLDMIYHIFNFAEGGYLAEPVKAACEPVSIWVGLDAQIAMRAYGAVTGPQVRASYLEAEINHSPKYLTLPVEAST